MKYYYHFQCDCKNNVQDSRTSEKKTKYYRQSSITLIQRFKSEPDGLYRRVLTYSFIGLLHNACPNNQWIETKLKGHGGDWVLRFKFTTTVILYIYPLWCNHKMINRYLCTICAKTNTVKKIVLKALLVTREMHNFTSKKGKHKIVLCHCYACCERSKAFGPCPYINIQHYLWHDIIHHFTYRLNKLRSEFINKLLKAQQNYPAGRN